MSESPFTLFFNTSVVVLCILLTCLEVVCLRRTPHLTDVWKSVMIISAVNYVFFWIFYYALSGYGVLFIVPIPLLPAIYIGSKIGLYYLMQKYSGSAIHSPWLVSILSMPVHGVVMFYLFIALMDILNPTNQNVDEAIRKKQDTRLAFLLAVGIAHEPYLTHQINAAIETDNVYAIRKLLDSGANPGAEYLLGRGTFDVAMMITEWRIKKGMPIMTVPSISFMSTAGSTEKLREFIDKGFDVAKATRTIHIAIENCGMAGDTLTEQESKSLIEKLQVLLDHGAVINETNEHGLSPLITALGVGDIHEVIEFLIVNGAEIDPITSQDLFLRNNGLPSGITPLMMAAVLKHAKSIEVLVKHHARKDIKDSSGKTALDYARSAGLGREILTLLE